MAPNEDAPEETYLDTQEGSAGPAQRRSRTRGLADEEEILPDEDLDKRQTEIGQRRKQGGPPLDTPITRSALQEVADSADVPPTECAEPPEE